MASQCTQQQPPSLVGLLQAMLFVIGGMYAVCGLAGEACYSLSRFETPETAIIDLRASGIWFPLDPMFRKAESHELSMRALRNENDPSLKEKALPVLYMALRDDPTSADLLVPAILFDLTTGHDPRPVYEMFKRVSKEGSALRNMVPRLEEMR